MLAAMEHLMRLHPAYCLGPRESHRSELKAVDEPESGHLRLRPQHECEADRSEPSLPIREATAITAILVVFCGAIAVIAFLAGNASNTGQQPVVATSYEADLR
jgi:hypothetical protein